MGASSSGPDFLKRWKIEEKEPTWQAFRFRLTHLLSDRDAFGVISLGPLNDEFLLVRGSVPESSTVYRTGRDGRVGKAHVIVALENAEGLQDIALAIQQLFWTLESFHDGLRGPVLRALREAIRQTPGVGLEVAVSGTQVSLYPAGAALLDQGAVNEPLAWLASRPEVAKPFAAALAAYQAKDPSDYRVLLDNLRFAFEQLLKSVLGNDKSLENQHEPLMKWLGRRGIHSQLVAMYKDLLGHFARYQNTAVKHAENWSADEVEFLIYLTGVFIRLLLRLEVQPGREEVP